jgi:hypothetical protein
MRLPVRSAAITTLVFIVYFIAGSLIADSLRFPYGYVSVGALLLFGWAGYHFSRVSGVVSSALATGVAALISALVTWAVLNLMGPNSPAAKPDAVAEVLVTMTLAATALGALGAGLAHLGHGSSSAA